MNHDDKIRNIEGIDNIICAEILDCNMNPDLYDIVISNMMHDSYDSAYSNSSCMKNEKCSKKYPRQFCYHMKMIIQSIDDGKLLKKKYAKSNTNIYDSIIDK